MKCEIVVIKSYELIMPNCTIDMSGKRDEYLLIEVLSPCEVVIGSKKFGLMSNDLVVVKKARLINSSNNIIAIRGVSFRLSAIGHQVSTLIVQIKMNLELKLLLDALLDINKLGRSYTQEESEEYLSYILEILFKNQTDKKNGILTGKIDPSLIKLIRYIRENIDEPLSLQDMADYIQYNPIYLSNMFSKVFNVSPIKYLQCLKMKRAKELVVNTNIKISDVASSLGYLSTSHFTEIFRRYHGCNPTKLRRKKDLNKNPRGVSCGET